MKKIAVFSTTRADFGLLKPLLKALKNDLEFQLLLFAGGTHFSPAYGSTATEIAQHGFEISHRFAFLPEGDSAAALCRALSAEANDLVTIFERYQFDAVCFLGDRIELLPIVECAIAFRKVIIHIHGGEITEGAIDDQVRNMITKAAHIHFPACETYAENLRRMGENPGRIFIAGALCVDNMIEVEQISREDLFGKLKLDPSKDTVLLTYHPVTLETEISPRSQIDAIFEALRKFDFQVVITAPNADMHRQEIEEAILFETDRNPRYYFFRSLGMVNYLNLVRHSSFMLGNSSSGLIEGPWFKKPTVNIGDRQKGRIAHESVINAGYSVDSIARAIEKAVSGEFKDSLSRMSYRFGDGKAAAKMVQVLKDLSFDNRFLRKSV